MRCRLISMAMGSGISIRYEAREYWMSMANS